MKIIKENDKVKLLDNKIEIEVYDFSKEINFKGLMEFLLEKNLTEKFELEFNTSDFNDKDLNLINIIQEVVDNYNGKVDEFLAFKVEKGIE